MMTSPIDSNTWDDPCRLALWASTRVSIDTVASERRHNHRPTIEKFYQYGEHSYHFSTDEVASPCFLQYFCVFHHYAPCKTRFGTVSQLSWTWLPKIEANCGEPRLGYLPGGFDWALKNGENSAILKRSCCWDQNTSDTGRQLIVAIIAGRRLSPLG